MLALVVDHRVGFIDHRHHHHLRWRPGQDAPLRLFSDASSGFCRYYYYYHYYSTSTSWTLFYYYHFRLVVDVLGCLW